MTIRKPQPTPIDLAREARRLALVRNADRVRDTQESPKHLHPRVDGRSGDDPKAAA